MVIWVDADACPNPIKQVIFRAAIKRQVLVYCIANKMIALPASTYIKSVVVAAGLDKADQYIVEQAQPGDLIITADVILADHSVTKGAIALNPRGTLYTPSTIKNALAIRNFNQGLRDSGVVCGGPLPLSKKDIQAFSQKFDKVLTASGF